MPTGYTAKLMEEGQTFQEFILGCARAFGACITMRDDQNDAPIPDKFEPSDYYAKNIVEAEEKLKWLKTMSETERTAFGEAEKAKEIDDLNSYINKTVVENIRLEEMEAYVNAWYPPTDDHLGLKKFMLEQIKISKNDVSYSERSLDCAKLKPPLAYYPEAISGATRDINYYTKEQAKKIDRVNDRNEWIRQLRMSI